MKKVTFTLLLIVLLLCSCGTVDNNGSDVDNYLTEEVTDSKINQTTNIVDKTVQETVKSSTYSHINENNKEINLLGNTYGNIANGGYAALYEGYIYYANGSDTGGSSDGKIYRISIDSSEKTKLCNDRGAYINVINRYVYFVNKSDDYRLYRMKLNGEEKERITEKRVWHINIVGNWIYFAIRYNNGIYKMNLNSSDNEPIELCKDECWGLNVVDEWIYYVNISDNGSIYKIKIDGSGRHKLCDDEVDQLIFCDGYLYYSNFNDEGKIYRINTDGQEKSLVCDKEWASYNIRDGFIYFSKPSTETGLYKMRLDDGTEKERINNDRTDCINIVGEWIYYDAVFAEHSDQYRIKTDGTYRQKVDPIN